MEHEGGGDTKCNCFAWNDTKKLCKEAGRFGNWRTTRDHLNHSIVKIGRNIQKSPGDLRRLAVTQYPVKNHQQTLV